MASSSIAGLQAGQPDLISTVGNTPLIELRRSGRHRGRLFAKLEMRNPAGSVKDRLAVALIDDAERHGVLPPGATIVAATGGNTGIGLAFVAAMRGYPLLLTMPESMSRERVALLEQLGAQVELTPGILMTEAVALARLRVEELPGAVLLDQFTSLRARLFSLAGSPGSIRFPASASASSRRC